MFTAEYEGVNSFLIGASNLLLKYGIKRETRGKKCCELPEPFMFKINNPLARLVTIPERKWKVVLPYAESLWLASGQNDLEMIGFYLKRMKLFSDDGFYLRGGYGPRLRHFNGNSSDYKINNQFENESKDYKQSEIDQFQFIISSFDRDINTRQAIINIGDPPKDCFDKNGCLKITEDFPCTRLLHFMKHPTENKLNLTVYMRSNDILWGASAVNIFNFTFMQEYFAKILKMEVGHYYHIANNFHFYEEKRGIIEDISNSTHMKNEAFHYEDSFCSLNEFDTLLKKLQIEENKLRQRGTTRLIDLEDDFFNDWYKVLYAYNTKRKVEFINPILNTIYN